MQHHGAWIDPVLVAEWVRLTRGYALRNEIALRGLEHVVEPHPNAGARGAHRLFVELIKRLIIM